MKLKLKYRIAVKLIDLLSKTWRIRLVGIRPDKPAIIAFWHGFMLPCWKYFSYLEPYAIVSASKDGEILSSLLKLWNFNLIRGSSSKKGKETLESFANKAKTESVLITPDGPRGPAAKMKPGAIIAAHRSGSPLYLCAVEVSSAKYFRKSWDDFCLPLPFSKIKLKLSEKIFIPENSTYEQINSYIWDCEKRLNDMQNQK